MEKTVESSTLSLLPFPNEIIDMIVAHVPKSERPKLRLISKHFSIYDKNWYEEHTSNGKIYIWGKDRRKHLGISYSWRADKHDGSLVNSTWSRADRVCTQHAPKLASNLNDPLLGDISDVQCGEYSVCILDDLGRAYITGMINEKVDTRLEVYFRHLRYQRSRKPRTYVHRARSKLLQLLLPHSCYDMALVQISVGPKTILGLTKDGTIWCWFTKHKRAIPIEFYPKLPGEALRICAGWNTSSAYIKGHGIVLWKTLHCDASPATLACEEDQPTDPITFTLIPDTRDDNWFAYGYGQVATCWILLEHHIVVFKRKQSLFVRKLDSPYQPQLCQIRHIAYHDDFATSAKDNLSNEFSRMRYAELNDLQQCSVPGHVQRLYGAYWPTFAVAISKTGSDAVVFIIREEEINSLLVNLAQSVNPLLPSPPQDLILRALRIPALQTGSRGRVTDVGFGKNHFLAIHTNGDITSYGNEQAKKPNGVLGLGTSKVLRGFDRATRSLQSHAYRTGRTVVFHNAMISWLAHLDQDISKDGDDKSSPGGRNAISDWIETELMNAHTEAYRHSQSLGQNPHRALIVSAGRSHSVALISGKTNEFIEAYYKYIGERTYLSFSRES